MKMMNIKTAAKLLLITAIAIPVFASAQTKLDDPSTVVTVMQFTLKDKTQKLELKKRMTAIRDYIRKQPGHIDNALMENRNGDQSPQFVGVSRWRSFKNWENMWLKPDFQKLIKSVSEVGDVNPGTFAPVK